MTESCLGATQPYNKITWRFCNVAYSFAPWSLHPQFRCNTITTMFDCSTMKSHCQLSLRQKKRQYRWKVFGAAFFLSCTTTLPTSAHAALPSKRPRNVNEQQQESLSISSSKTKAAVHADTSSDTWNKSTRMADQEHFAQHLLSSTGESNDFANRLLEELSDEESIASSTTADTDPLESLIFYGIITLAFTSALLTPTIFVNSMWTMLSSVALLLPWLWFGRGSIFSKETAIMCITYVLQLSPRLERDGILFQRVLPVAAKMLQQMVIAEAWSRVWRIAGRKITRLFDQISLERQDQNNNNNNNNTNLFYKIHEFLDTSIRKGTHKSVTKTVERNVQAAIGTTLESVLSVLERAVLPLVLLPFQGTIPNSAVQKPSFL